MKPSSVLWLSVAGGFCFASSFGAFGAERLALLAAGLGFNLLAVVIVWRRTRR